MQLQADLSLALEIRGLLQQIAGCERDALGYAREIGDLLRSVPSTERPRLWEEAGLKRRNAFNYMNVARFWDRVQRAASIRQALEIIKGMPRAGKERPLPFEDRCVVVDHGPLDGCPPVSRAKTGIEE